MYKKEFMEEAIKLANECFDDGAGGPFGAVIVKDGKIIGRGRNRVTIDNDPSAHAEICAIRDACKKLGTFQLSGCELYASSEPCPMCFGAIYWSRPDRVYFSASCEVAAEAGFDDTFIYKEIGKPIDEYSITTEQHFEPKSAETFKKWLNFENKIDY